MAATNLITQALINAESAEKEIAAIQGLPTEAQPIQAGSVKLIGQIVPTVRDMQGKIQGFVKYATPLLATALTELDGSNPIQAKDPIIKVQAAAKEITPVVAAADSAVQTGKTTTDELAKTATTVDSKLNGDIVGAQSRLHTDQQEVNSLNQKKYLWLLLGPLGLPGLAAAIAMIVTANNKVAAVEGEISSLAGQLARFTKVKADVQMLTTDLRGLSGKLQSLKNGVDFVTADIDSVLKDLNDTKVNAPAAKAFVLTAQTELATLASETA